MRCLLLLSCQLLSCAAVWSAETRRPNIIVMLCDDLGYGDPSCYGARHWQTPNVDRLAREGLRLTAFYSCPLCTPSRGCLMTGRYPWTTGLNEVLFPNDKVGIAATETTLPEVLKGAGYATGMIGKWHLGHLPQFLPTAHGFDSWFGIPYSNDMGLWAGADLSQALVPPPSEVKGERIRAPLMRDATIVECPTDQTTLTRRYGDAAVAFIEANRAKPFFLYLAHAMPHLPLAASPEFARAAPQGGLYGGVMQEIDASVGRVLDCLDRLKLADDTLVIFTSDNGPWAKLKPDEKGVMPVMDLTVKTWDRPYGSAGGLRGCKGNVWEGGVRVPCVLRWPGRFGAGQVRTQVGSLVDLLPTLATAAGAPAPKQLDGVNLLPMLVGDASWVRPPLFLGGKPNTVRVGRWKRHASGALYDLDADPSESTDVAAAHPEEVARLAKAVADAGRRP
jgi:arylsulfatase A